MRKTISIVSVARVLCGVLFCVMAVSQAGAQTTATEIVVDDSLGDTKTSIIWDFDSQSFAVAVDEQPLLDAVTVIDDAGSPVLLGRWIDGSPTLRVEFGIDGETGNLLVYWHVEGQEAIRFHVVDAIVVAKEVCRCSAVGPAGGVCKGAKDCTDNVSCGTGKLCQYRYSNSVDEVIPLE